MTYEGFKKLEIERPANYQAEPRVPTADGLRLALESVAEGRGDQIWQAIETAPKDGSEFLAYDVLTRRFDVCEMVELKGAGWVCYPTQIDSEIGPLMGDFGYDRRGIQFWCSLPAAPV